MENVQIKMALLGRVSCFLILIPILLGARSESVSVSQLTSPLDFVLWVHGDLISLKAEHWSPKAICETIG